MRPHYAFALLPLFAATACTFDQSNGYQGSFNPPILADQSWQISDQGPARNGDPVCTVSAGEMDVTQRTHNGHMLQEVSTNYKLNPGDRYKVLFGSHVYETPNIWFNADQSARIIRHLLHERIVYTEIEVRVINTKGEWNRIPNKIPLGSFPHTFRQCTAYVKGHS